METLQVGKVRFCYPDLGAQLAQSLGGEQRDLSGERQALAFKVSAVFQITAAPLRSDEGLQDVDRNTILLAYIFLPHALFESGTDVVSLYPSTHLLLVMSHEHPDVEGVPRCMSQHGGLSPVHIRNAPTSFPAVLHSYPVQ